VDPVERALSGMRFPIFINGHFPGVKTDAPLGGVSWWSKQDEIHQATYVHRGPEFLPWHRRIDRIAASVRSMT
jgi:hypothetical protein